MIKAPFTASMMHKYDVLNRLWDVIYSSHLKTLRKMIQADQSQQMQKDNDNGISQIVANNNLTILVL